ncbi:Fc.00g103280.m01.CDS01 [Cosmosporella sp. VM-42]
MEPSSKKRKLAPKVNSSAPKPQPAQYSHEPPQQHYPVQETPLAERHDFESFARHLQDAAMLIQRQTERPSYTDVSVLLLRWEEDESVNEDLLALEQLLQKQYNYHTERWQIPTVPNPSIKLGVQMASFLEHARPNHLLIIYYAGHGYVGPDGQLYWACNAREDAAKLKWDGVRCLFEDAQSDILLLLDTCSVPDPPMAGSHGVKQAIAAYTPDRNQPDGSERSFTSNLVESLHKFSTGRPFSVQRLYEEIQSQKQQQIAQAPRIANGGANPPPSPQTPIFFPLTPGKVQSLSLAPLPPRTPPAAAQNGGDPDQTIRDREEQVIDPESVSDLRFDEPRILVCTTFVGDASPDMSFFTQWLQHTPPLGAKIAVEGMFLGPPTMLLISMPHSIWNVVQHDKVCCFLGYISSHNMIHLYQRLVGSSGIKPSAKEVEDGRILLEAREVAVSTPARIRRDNENHEHPYHSSAARDGPGPVDRQDYLPQTSPSVTQYAQAVNAGVSIKPKDEVEDSAEMQEAAEQLKALSHVRHRSDEARQAVDRPRTVLPDGMPEVRHDDTGSSHDANESGADESMMSVDYKMSPNARLKAPRRSLPKQETRCNHCSHAPFKDSSSLRKHIAAAHTRPFPCAFSFAGCTSTFGSKNEWKRHISSQHLCLQYYRCSSCSNGSGEGKTNEFNRKDLFTQHLRRMHAPFPIKRAIAKGDSKMQSEWETHVKDMQQTCLIQRRLPPQRSACPKSDCQSVFEGPTAWDEWTEHVGRHMEKGEGQRLGVDGLLAKWALDENIIEPKGNGEYRLVGLTVNTTPVHGNIPISLDTEDSIHVSPPVVHSQVNSQPEETITQETTQVSAGDKMEVDD